jgi:hypothetical protein
MPQPFFSNGAVATEAVGFEEATRAGATTPTTARAPTEPPRHHHDRHEDEGGPRDQLTPQNDLVAELG